ncbi:MULTISPECIES: DUF6338 family protein [unclassified Serratia (in: enterobacteria)]|uniref:DUF6338 family protein n=1 Tax=unclassified Serratia (in: enterobacteria) TaxID=2647522 RepID=UPI000500AACC|nr:MULTISPECIES: DUF6338 family protein [unclassified Serratia (in: enterobacteria)]KFK96603.1 hypothetical protein JV45_04585 [Serratia sp. Ag2]KFK99777.1 hypothetical protein IV04_04160 [Serratia sp. Ag1]
MEILDLNKILIFMFFVIPGFISLKVYAVLIPSVNKTSSEQMIDAVAYSCINYAVWGLPFFYFYINGYVDSGSIIFYVYGFFLLFVFPSLNPGGLILLRKWDFVAKRLPHPTGKPWDYFFSLRLNCWVVVTLNDGSKIGGAYRGDAFASSAPEPEQIYLSEHWVVNGDGGFERSREDTLGILILSSDIRTVEFFKMKPTA